MNKEKWEPCPRCESKKVKATGKGTIFFVGFLLAGISIWLLIIPPIGILGILIGIGMMITSPFFPVMLQCKDCKKMWKYKKNKEITA
jgi:multisubunit Na+/H+ antiporter MnhG subunit